MFYWEYNIQDYQKSGEVVFIISYLSSDLSEGSLVHASRVSRLLLRVERILEIKLFRKFLVDCQTLPASLETSYIKLRQIYFVSKYGVLVVVRTVGI